MRNPRIVVHLVTDYFVASRRGISATTLLVSMQDDQLRKRNAYVVQENTFLIPNSTGVFYSSLETDSGRLLIWREYTLDTTNLTLFKHTGTEVMESGFWQYLSRWSHNLHVFHAGALNGVRYRNVILDSHDCPYTCAIGNGFIAMDDNARSHQAVVVEDYLTGHVFQRMALPTLSPDLNQIKKILGLSW